MFRVFSKTRFISINIQSLQKQLLIHCTALRYYKKVHDSEFEFFSKFVHSSKESEDYNEKFKTFDERSVGDSSENLVKEFVVYAKEFKEGKTRILQERFDDLNKNLVKNVSSFDDDLLKQVLVTLLRISNGSSTELSLQRCPNQYQEKYDELLAELDHICYERGRKWSQSELLKMCSLWFKLKVHSKFIEGALSKLRRGFFKLPKEIFIETFFYLTACRRDVPLTLLEVRLNEMFDELTSNEIGIFCMCMLKSDVWIRDTGTVHKLYDKTFAEIETIEEITLQYFLKQLRVSSELPHIEKTKKLCDILLQRIDNYSLKTCLHIGLLGTNSEYCNQKLIEAVVKKFNAKIETAIVKNFADLSLILSHFNFKTESEIEKELMKKIIRELKLRVDEIVKVPSCLAVTMNNLTLCGVHDIEIIKAVLTEKFYKFAYGKQRFNIGPEILSLDSYTRINLKDTYDGPQLSPMIRSCIMKGQLHVPPKRDKNLKVSEKVLYDIKDLMEKLYGKNVLTNILPHFKRSDIIYCFDETGKSVTEDIADCFPPVFSGEIVSKEFLLTKKPGLAEKFDKLQMIAVILGYSNFFLHGTNQRVGELQMKIQQLEMIGYKTVVIKWDDWFKSRYEERKKLINGEMQKVLKLQQN